MKITHTQKKKFKRETEFQKTFIDVKDVLINSSIYIYFWKIKREAR